MSWIQQTVRKSSSGTCRQNPVVPSFFNFHGNGDFLAGFFGRFHDLIADGVGVVGLSYRGYAGSSGHPSEQDAAAAYAFTVARYSPDRIVAWGFSLGTGVAVALAAERPGGRLILEAPYSSAADVAASLFWFLPVRLVMRDRFRSDERIVRVKTAADHAWWARSGVPIRFGERLFALANEPKQFVRFPEGGHENLQSFGAIETARHFISGTKG